jgi:hypothetical protein
MTLLEQLDRNYEQLQQERAAQAREGAHREGLVKAVLLAWLQEAGVNDGFEVEITAASLRLCARVTPRGYRWCDDRRRDAYSVVYDPDGFDEPGPYVDNSRAYCEAHDLDHDDQAAVLRHVLTNPRHFVRVSNGSGDVPPGVEAVAAAR